MFAETLCIYIYNYICFVTTFVPCRGAKIGAYYVRFFKERERFQNGQETAEGVGYYEEETYEGKTNYAEKSLHCNR